MKNNVEVSVSVQFVPERSDPKQPLYFYAYTVTITNRGEQPCTLLSRHWIITDSTGHIEEVRGPGVVGEQPHLSPGESFEYTSACPLSTTSGSMRGSYQMQCDDGDTFDAIIEPFALVRREALN
jgi:ApaG protein